MFKRFALVMPLAAVLVAAGAPVSGQSQTSPEEQTVDGSIILRGLKVSPALIPNPVDVDELPIYLRGDEMNAKPDEELIIEGRGVVRRADTVLSAGYLRYDDRTNEVDARINARLVQDGNVIVGPSMRYNLDTDEGEVESPEFWLSNGGSGIGSKAVMTNRNELTIDDVTYTACPCPEPAWWITALESNFDYDANEGEAWGAVLFFKGMPILASPYLTFPIRRERKSGFLAPTFAITSQSGYEMTLPYYLNLAPNYDATLQLRPMSKRGVQLGGDFRYLGKTFNGTIAGTYLQKDQELGIDRWLYSTQHSQSFGGGFYGGWNISGVSDDDYFKDFSILAVNQATITALPRSGWVGWGSKFWSAQVNYSTFQTLGDITPQYNLVPAVTLTGSRYNYGGFDVVMDNSAIWFERAKNDAGQQLGPNGQRFVSYPQISYPIVQPGYYITPKVGLHMTRYETTWQPGLPEDQFRPSNSRVLPIMSIDAGMTFERDASFFGHDAIQTLEPRIYYLNVPYRDQSNFPVYDTTLSDFSFSQAFQENIYTGGWDRIANANQLTVALGSRYLNATTGEERAYVALGQRFYFEDQLVTLPGERARTDVESEYLISAGADLTNTLSTALDLQYNPYDNSWDRAQIVARFNPKRAAAISVSYRYQRNPPPGVSYQPQGQDQVSLSYQWPLTSQIYSVGRVDYSLLSEPDFQIFPRVTQAIAGLEYRGDCCWAARVIYQRYAIDPTQVNNAIFFQLELSGLGRLGQDPLGLLGRSIPNYQNITPTVEPIGKFERYE
ncbi:MAG: LPS-assembly protein LptD [Burkholderiaceae bacterium]|nr:LPS-assembly protein LptD [Burkholderiaceae bacterium]